LNVLYRQTEEAVRFDTPEPLAGELFTAPVEFELEGLALNPPMPA
jgi:hypothetical protein